MSQRIAGSQLLLEALRANGIDHLFGLPGGHNLTVYSQLCRYPEIRHISARTEYGLGFLADGYSRVSGKIAVLLTTAGPGITNVLTSLATANAESVPLLLLAINNYRSFLDRRHGLFHELADSASMLTSVTSLYTRVNTPVDLLEVLRHSLANISLLSSKPVAIEIPSDVLTATEEFPAGISFVLEKPRRGAFVSSSMLDLICSAKQPILYVGRGAVIADAGGVIQELAERLLAPIVTTAQARGLVPDTHPLSLGCLWDRIRPLDSLARDSDLVIAIGTSLSRLATRFGSLPLPKNLIHIDADPLVLGRLYTPAVSVLGDARDVVSKILFDLTDRRLDSNGRIVESIEQDVSRHKIKFHESFCRNVPSVARILKAIEQSLPRNTVVVGDMTVAAYWASCFLPCSDGVSFISPYHFGALGYALPAAIGAKVAQPSRPVLCLIGDGGFLFNSQELATAVRESAPIVVLLLNDSSYRAIDSELRRVYQVEHPVTDLNNPDFVRLAESYGWTAETTSIAELSASLGSALKGGKPHLIEVKITERLPMPNEVKWDN